MARKAGRNARIYVGIASGGTAEPIAFQTNWTLDSSTDDIDVTAFGDSNKVYVSGLPDASGSFAGFFDDESNQLYTASQDGVARKFYLYTDNTVTTKYWFGTGLFDFSVDVGVNDALKVSGNFKAASPVIRVG